METTKQSLAVRSLEYGPLVQEDEVSSLQTPMPSPPLTGSTVQSNVSSGPQMAFTKAAVAFKGTLDDVRHKRISNRTSIATTLASPTSPGKEEKTPTVSIKPIIEDGEETADKALDTGNVSGLSRSIRLLRTLQSLLTSIISLTIAFLQGRAYVSYLKTKDVSGAWPTHPNLFPTILLLAVAVAATTFDLSLIIAYCAPKNKQLFKTMMKIAKSSHTFIVSAKTASYAITAAVCKSGFNFGNSSGQNNDLWSWTCTDPSMLNTVTSANSQCASQCWAWYFALINIGIEVIGGLINVLLFFQQRKNKDDGDEDYDKMAETIKAELADVTPHDSPKA